MVSTWFQTLYYEIGHRMDITVWTPAAVDTRMAHGEIPTALMLSAEKAVRGALCQLGRTKHTDGNYFFYISNFFLGFVEIFSGAVERSERNAFIEKT